MRVSRVVCSPYYVKRAQRVDRAEDRWHPHPRGGEEPSGVQHYRRRTPEEVREAKDVHSHRQNDRNLVDAAVVASELCFRLSVDHAQKLGMAIAMRMSNQDWDDSCAEAARYLVDQLALQDYYVLQQMVSSKGPSFDRTIFFFAGLVPHARNQRLSLAVDQAKARNLIAKVVDFLVGTARSTRVTKSLIKFTTAYSVLPSAHSLECVQAVHDLLSEDGDVHHTLKQLHRTEFVSLSKIFAVIGASLNEPSSKVTPDWGGHTPDAHNLKRLTHAYSNLACDAEFLASLDEYEITTLIHGVSLSHAVLPKLITAICECVSKGRMYEVFTPITLCEFLYRVALSRCVHPIYAQKTLGPMFERLAQPVSQPLSPVAISLMSKALVLLKIRQHDNFAAVITSFASDLEQVVAQQGHADPTLLPHHRDAGDSPTAEQQQQQQQQEHHGDTTPPPQAANPQPAAGTLNPTTLYLVLNCMVTLRPTPATFRALESLCRSLSLTKALPRCYEEYPRFHFEQLAYSISYLYLGRVMPHFVRDVLIATLKICLDQPIQQGVARMQTLLSSCVRIINYDGSVLRSESGDSQGPARQHDTQEEEGDPSLADPHLPRTASLSALTSEQGRTVSETITRCVGVLSAEVDKAARGNGEAQIALNESVLCGYLWSLGSLSGYTVEALGALNYLVGNEAAFSSLHPAHAWWVLNAMKSFGGPAATAGMGGLRGSESFSETAHKSLREFSIGVCVDLMRNMTKPHVLREFNSVSAVRLMKSLRSLSLMEEVPEETNALMHRIVSDTSLVGALTYQEAVRLIEALSWLRAVGIRDPKTAERECFQIYLSAIHPNTEYLLERDPIDGVVVLKTFADMRIHSTPPVVMSSLAALGAQLLTRPKSGKQRGGKDMPVMSPVSETLVMSSVLKLGIGRSVTMQHVCREKIATKGPMDVKQMKWLLYGLAKTVDPKRNLDELVAGLCSVALKQREGAPGYTGGAPHIPRLEFHVSGGKMHTHRDMTLLLWSLCRLQCFPPNLLHLTTYDLLRLQEDSAEPMAGVKPNNLVTMLVGLASPATLGPDYRFLDAFFAVFLKRVAASGALRMLDYPRLRSVVSNLMERQVDSPTFYREARQALVDRAAAEEEENAKRNMPHHTAQL